MPCGDSHHRHRNIIEFDTIHMLSNDLVANNLFKTSNAEIVSSQVPLRIELVQTGGIHGEHMTRPFDDDPLLEIGQRYMLFLKKAIADHLNVYWILGGHQGVADIVQDQIVFRSEYYPEDFSDLNVMLADFTEKLLEFDLDQKKYIINTESKPVELLIRDLLED